MGGVWRHLWACGVSLHTCTCMCMHTHTHTHVYMYRNCKWPLKWRHQCFSCLTYMLLCVCIHACMCVHGAWCPPPHTHPQPNPPTCQPPRGDPQNQSKFNNTCTNQDNSILFEDLNFVENSPSMGG